MMIESIKDGFSVTNRNLQLVFIRIAVTIINLLGFFVCLGVPLVLAALYLGMDLSHIRDLVPFIIRSPFEFLSKYLMLLFIAGTAFIFYLLFSSLLFIYILAGMLGTLKKSAVNIQYRFSFSSFFRTANRNFSGLFRLISVSSIFFILMTVAVMITAGILIAISQAFGAAGTSLAVFSSSFVTISIIVFGAIGVIAGFILIVYSMVALFVDGNGAIDSIKKAFVFLKNRPGAFLFYMVLFAVLMLVNIAFVLLKLVFGMVPVMAPLLAVFLAMLNAFFHSYIALVMWSSLVAYYLKSVDYPVYSATYEI